MEGWDRRAIKSIKIESTENVTTINRTGTFELYVLYNDLKANPVSENAAFLREQAREDGNSLCTVTFPTYDSNWVNSVIARIAPVDSSSACDVDVCETHVCQAILNKNNETLEYHNCEKPCDVVIGVRADGKFIMFTVSYPDVNHTKPNNITLIGLFDGPSTAQSTEASVGPSSFFGIPINSPVHPNIVPRFSTLQDLSDRMGQVLSIITSIATTVTVKYLEGALGKPGSLLFGIGFEEGVQTPPISFNPSLQLGDLASVKVQNGSFGLLGNMYISNEFGMVFTPDDSSSLKLAGARKNEEYCTRTAFNATIIFEKNNTKGNETISIIPACDIDGKLVSLAQAFAGSAKLKKDVNVTAIGTSGTFALVFDPLYSFIKVVVEPAEKDNLARFGIASGYYEKKPSFQYTSGLLELIAGIEVLGGVNIKANVADVLEVTAAIDASFFGQVQFSAGKLGQLIPFDDFLAKLVSLKDTSSEYHDPDFAVSVLTFGGTLAGQVSADTIGVSTGVTGAFLEPYNSNLLHANNTGPKFALDVNLPKFGDLRNLSYSDVINLLSQALELLVGPAEADTVDSCSGGLLGKDIFTTKIPVAGVSACDFASVLQVVVDAVDSLVNECSGCTNSSETSGDPTFQALEVKLTNLLQGTILLHTDFCPSLNLNNSLLTLLKPFLFFCFLLLSNKMDLVAHQASA